MAIEYSPDKRGFSPRWPVCLLHVALVLGGYFGGETLALSLGPGQEAAAAPQRPGEQQGVSAAEEEPPEEAPSQDRSELLSAATEGAQAEVEKAVSAVDGPDQQALAQALHVERETASPEGDDSAGPSLEPVGDLDGDGNLEYVYRWTGPLQEGATQTGVSGEGAWNLFLLAWDGQRWRVSNLLAGEGLYDLHVLPRLGDVPGLAVVEGLGQVPFPIVFKFQDHTATLAWDSRDGESKYQGFAAGEVEFRDADPDAPPEMLVTGKADPGLVHFPRASNRGFGIATLYTWDDMAFVPKKIAYSPCEDYTFYRFVSALHLKDFRTAFALIDPLKFLKSKDPSPETFRKYVESTLPEFLGDNIFEAPDTSQGAPKRFDFELNLNDQHYTYHPTFSNDEKFLLTGLERREEK
jgi:hypothetical protein